VGSLRFTRVSIVVLLLVVISVAILSESSVVRAQQNGVSPAISTAQTKIVQCFDAARAAESAGANISSLTSVLNSAGVQLSNAELAYSSGNSGLATSLASQSQSSLGGFLSDAAALKSSAVARSNLQILLFVGSIVGTFAVIGASAAVWVLLKRKNGNRAQKVNLTQYKVLFIVVTAVVSLLVASPALQRVSVYPQTQFFTELSLLGSGHMADNYPFDITLNANYTAFIGLTNQLGSAAYYQIEVKFANETQSAPSNVNSTTSGQPSLYNLAAFVANKESLEIPVNFGFDYSFQNDAQTVNFDSLMLNGQTLNLQGYSSNLNSQTNVFYGNLIFELWIYNSTIGGFQYNNRFVNLELNMTSIGMGN